MPKQEALSPRRVEALKLKAEGLNTPEIALRMGITRQRAWVLCLPEERRGKMAGSYKARYQNKNPLSTLLSVGEAAAILHIHYNTLRRWSDEGRIKSVRRGSRNDRRFSRRDVEAYLHGCLKTS